MEDDQKAQQAGFKLLHETNVFLQDIAIADSFMKQLLSANIHCSCIIIMFCNNSFTKNIKRGIKALAI